MGDLALPAQAGALVAVGVAILVAGCVCLPRVTVARPLEACAASTSVAAPTCHVGGPRPAIPDDR